MLEAFDDRLFAALAAAPATQGYALDAAVFIARWMILMAPLSLALLWILGTHAERSAAVLAGMSAVVAVALAAAISAAWMHPRPFMVHPVRNFLDHAPDSSFPSDHSTVLFALGFALCILPSKGGRMAGIFTIVLAVAVGWSRVYLAAHYPSDIMGAAAVAAISTSVMAFPVLRNVCDRLTLWGEHLFGWSIASNLSRTG
jgi:undecaprenyl-diphosphatase